MDPKTVISDILAGGTSARLFRSLVKEKKLFSAVNAYITGDLDPGMFVLNGQILPSVSLAKAEEAIWSELERLKTEPVGEYELEKVKNKFEASTTFGELNVMNKALNLAYYEMLGDIALINEEIDMYRSVTPGEILETAACLFVHDKSSTLVIHGEKDGK